MAQKLTELRKDLDELNSLEKQATRSCVKNLLSLEARRLTAEISKLESLEAQTNSASSSKVNTSNNDSKRYQVKINNYAWDQTEKYIKFYVTLQKVHSIPEGNITCNFSNKSLELLVKDLEGKDYLFTINNLLESIDPAQSNWKIKTDMILINAAKVQAKTWSHVTELEKKISEARNFKPDEEMDPNEGLMSLMKKMYDSGDDEMKKTIAKAWTESQTKSNVL